MFPSTEHTFAVCAYKESPFLENCMKSLEAQTCKTNTIICTSTPNDHIYDVARRYNVPVMVRDEQPNIADDWNFAIETAETPLVTIAHQDDVYCFDYAEKMLAALNSAESPLIFFSDYGEIRNDKQIDSNRLLEVKRKLIAPMKNPKNGSSTFWKRSILRFGNAICCPSVTYNKETIPLPLFKKGMKNSLDWEAWERLSKEPGSFCYSPKLLMYHRIHKDSETTRLIADNTRTAEDLEMLKRFWPAPIAKLINGVYSKGQNSNAG